MVTVPNRRFDEPAVVSSCARSRFNYIAFGGKGAANADNHTSLSIDSETCYLEW